MSVGGEVLLRRLSRVLLSVCFLLIWVGISAGSDQSEINALLDRFEAAVQSDDISAVEKCLFKKGFLQVYDYGIRGVHVYGTEQMLDKEWYISNRFIKFENRQITLEGNLAYVRCTENSMHHSGSNPHYKDLIIVVKHDRKWFIAVLSGRQLDF